MDGVVKAGQSRSCSHDLVEFGNSIVDKVAVFSGAEEYNRVRTLEEIIGISRPVDRVAGSMFRSG